MKDDKLKLKIECTEENLLEYLDELSPEMKQKVLEHYTFDEIVQATERQLRHETDLYSWSTDGWRDGMKMREAILKAQGIEPEFKADLEFTIRDLKSDLAHYKKYYDWYYKLRNAARQDERYPDESYLYTAIQKIVGWL